MNKSFMDYKGIVLNCNAGGKFLTVVTWARLFFLCLINMQSLRASVDILTKA